jgi:4-hydroxy-tetrahydrodipicolinate synthase
VAAIQLSDVVVATVLPFTEAGDIDWQGYRRVLEYCAPLDGISAVFVNGHAGEGAALTVEERVKVIEFTRDFLGGSKLLISGIIAFSTMEAIAEARRAKDAGADVGTIFPTPLIAAGGCRTPVVPMAFVKAIHDAVDMPMAIFQYPLASGNGYTTETLVEMAKLPRCIAIKEGSDTIMAYEDNWRQVKAAAPNVAMLPSNFDWFLAQVAVGADGILSGLASLTPHFLVDLWRATEAKDLVAMRKASDALFPIVRTIYGAPPRMDMHTRMKVALRHLGIIDCATPRAPLLPVSPEIEAKIIDVTDRADLARFARPVVQARGA